MKIPVELFILFSAMLGAAIGTLGMHLYYRHQIARKERESWNTARVFYTRKKQDA